LRLEDNHHPMLCILFLQYEDKRHGLVE